MLYDLHIITCSSTYDRLPKLLSGLEPLFSFCKPQSTKLIISHDIGHFRQDVFNHYLWPSHIESISGVLALNIRDSALTNSQNPFYQLPLSTILQSCSDLTCFPPRPLRLPEQSLLWKHFTSLGMVQNPTLVIEDDAILLPNTAQLLISYISCLHSNNYYIDFGSFPGLTKRGHPIELFPNNYAFYQKIANTRTTLAFAVNAYVASSLASKFWPCSLPADLHFQYLLNKSIQAGIWPSLPIFSGDSSDGSVPSSIQS